MEQIRAEIADQPPKHFRIPLQALRLCHRATYRYGDNLDPSVVVPTGVLENAIAGNPAVRHRHRKGDAETGERAELGPVVRVGIQMGDNDRAHFSEGLDAS
jgi:hypothetical protein